MKSFKRMVIISSTLLCGLLLAANYTEQKSDEPEKTHGTKTPAEQVDVLQPGYPGLVAGISVVAFY